MIKKYQKPLEDFYFKFRKMKDAALKPLIIALDKFRISANLITLFRVTLVVIASALIKWNVYFSFWMFVLVYLLDGLDGSLARYQKKTSERGALFDLLSDQFTVIGLILGLIFFRKVEAFSAALYLVLFVSLVFFSLREKSLEKVPYFYNKFWIVAAATFWVFTGNNFLDATLIGLNIYLLTVLTFDIYCLLKIKR